MVVGLYVYELSYARITSYEVDTQPSAYPGFCVVDLVHKDKVLERWIELFEKLCVEGMS